MFSNRTAKLALVFAMAFVLLLFSMGARAESNSAALVTLTTDQTSFTATQDVVVHVTISNPNSRTVKLLKWFTPVEDVEEPLFTVMLDGKPVQYVGAVYKRPAPTAADYVSLKRGESITRDVRLSDYYDLSRSGTYEIAYNVAAWNLVTEKATSKKVARLASEPLQMTIEGRQVRLPGASDPMAVAGTTFNKCTVTQQNTLISARNQASTYSNVALAYLQANNQGSRYTTWFGVYNSSRYSTVTSHFGSIANAMSNAPVKIDCGCKKTYYAYVYPTQPYTIYVCKAFWSAPMTGTDSKAGTLIHEMTHFNVVIGTDDYVYGQAGAKSLAISNPSQAIDNADNHEYFAENTPALP